LRQQRVKASDKLVTINSLFGPVDANDDIATVVGLRNDCVGIVGISSDTAPSDPLELFLVQARTSYMFMVRKSTETSTEYRQPSWLIPILSQVHLHVMLLDALQEQIDSHFLGSHQQVQEEDRFLML
jgi:hypothetical protein